MSDVANWSYTAQATYWPAASRDDWTGGQSFGAPVTFGCTYATKSKTRTDSRGNEYTSRMVIYCEQDGVRPGDRIAIGAHEVMPENVETVRDVLRSHDVFDNALDDYEVVT